MVADLRASVRRAASASASTWTPASREEADPNQAASVNSEVRSTAVAAMSVCGGVG